MMNNSKIGAECITASTSNSNPENQHSSVTNSSTSGNTTNETKISPEEAQKIAQKYIEEEGQLQEHQH
ncbi:hypothetical protein [Methanobacterium sp.]|uniref:hypothetical protein n=1 Tax=Methanobacterium sp. TaxID=2164 RepID=UPI003C72BD72